METGEATLVIIRTADQDIKMRDLYIRVDDLPERTLQFGDRVSMPLAAGKHTVLGTNRLFKKLLTVELERGQTVTVQAANVPGGCLYIPLYIVSGTGGYRVTLERA